MRRIIVATAFLAGTFAWTVANATHGDPQVDPKLNASVFNSKLVQAFDECDPSEATTLPDDTLACAGGELDGTPFNLGKVVVKSKVFPSTKPNIIMIMKSSGTQAKKDTGTPPLAGKEIQLKLVLRISETDAESAPGATGTCPGAGCNKEDQVTWVDTEVFCPAITVPSNGNVVQKTNLGACTQATTPPAPLTLDQLKNTSNKEIVSVAVIDAISKKAIAVPGVRKK